MMTRTEKIHYNIILGILKGISYLPFFVLYRISDVLRWLLQYVIKYRRKVIRENLQKVFADYDQKQLREIETKFYNHLCDIMVETVKILHLSDEELTKRVQMKGIEQLNDCMSSGTPVIAFLGHYGNWEWVQELSARMDNRFIFGEIYRPVHSEISNILMKKIRSRWNTILISQNEAVRTILKLKNEGKVFLIGFIADQRPNGVVLNNWCKFLKQPTAYVTGAEAIGRKVGAAYFYVDIKKTHRGHYLQEYQQIFIDAAEEKDPYPYTIKYLHLMEQSIYRNPELWLWSHKRWAIPDYCKIPQEVHL